jgi:CRISPR/Cas system-associated exonuclease Cas4 (RecB family)
MNTQYDLYDLFAHTDEFLTRAKFATVREKRFYPSEASVEFINEHGDKEVHGTCLRASYFRLTGQENSTPYDARAEFIFMHGKETENMLVETWKKMGIWVDNNVKFIMPEYNVSGELDALLREPDGTLYGVEVKSFYGYNAEKEIFGNKSQIGKPKMSQLLQTLIYCYNFRDRLPYFRMAYFARDSVKRRTFKVELHQQNGKHYPKIEGQVWYQFSVEDILARYKRLQEYIDKKEIPPNDYELQYPPDKIIDLHSKGKIAKTTFETWEKQQKAIAKGKMPANPEQIGDWQCSYCAFKNVCWK